MFWDAERYWGMMSIGSSRDLPITKRTYAEKRRVSTRRRVPAVRRSGAGTGRQRSALASACAGEPHFVDKLPFVNQPRFINELRLVDDPLVDDKDV